ncbi:hypothetical protein ACFLVB_04490 [Chloroflexota bacterium]
MNISIKNYGIAQTTIGFCVSAIVIIEWMTVNPVIIDWITVNILSSPPNIADLIFGRFIFILLGLFMALTGIQIISKHSKKSHHR